MSTVKIGVVAPASRLAPEAAERVTKLTRAKYGDCVEIVCHPQCFLTSGHFAGDDAARAAAFVEVANDPTFHALWAARGGYGSNRIAERVIAALKPAARDKIYFGYSDIGFLLAALYKAGFPKIAHGPVVSDINRVNGEVAVERALGFLVDGAKDTIEPSVADVPTAAFNLTILSNLLGTPLQPDLSGHVLMLEDVSEEMYRIDRTMFHLTADTNIRKVAGIRLGRCSDIPPNDPEFCASEEAVVKDWCGRATIPYLGRADIGHDISNKVVPFGRWRP